MLRLLESELSDHYTVFMKMNILKKLDVKIGKKLQMKSWIMEKWKIISWVIEILNVACI